MQRTFTKRMMTLVVIVGILGGCKSLTEDGDGTLPYTFTTPGQYRAMVSLAGGTITGNPAYDNPVSSGDYTFLAGRTVTISPFNIAKYETTYELWYEVKQWANGHGYTFANAGFEGHDGTGGAAPTASKNEPVTTINWRDAIVWCNAYSELSGKEPVYYTDSTYTTVLRTSTNDTGTATAADGAKAKPGANGYRLPTEAEWEYAARGGGTPGTTGSFANQWAGTNTESELGNYAWYDTNSGGGTHPVGGKTANAAGLYDMSGNVWEWCWDWYDTIGTGSATNPAGPLTVPISTPYRVIRGCSWSYIASFCAVACRANPSPVDRWDHLGFRLVCP
jgi:formylglycine-generating enzyme required for sulfatase activity